MKTKHIILAGGCLALLLGLGSVWASTVRMKWVPGRLAPESIAPGESKTFTATLYNNGPSSLETQHLEISVSGDVASLVVVEHPVFPVVIKRRESVSLGVKVHVPETFPMSIVRGELALVRSTGEGKKERIFLSDTLPIEITASAISLPPDPGEAGKVDVLGIDSNGNSVRDDIERFIAFQFPDSEKKRMALMQYAQEMQIFLRDADDKEKTIANAHAEKGRDCMEYVFGGADSMDRVESGLRAEVLNTSERSRAYTKADAFLGGQVFDGPLLSELHTFLKSQCSFDPDALSN
jgi:hypothetical protein